MNKTLWYTDPHFGTDLKANTTRTSRVALRDAQYLTVGNAIEKFRTANPVGTVGCAGDFFDTDSNDEDTIIRSLGVANKTDIILGGNHDVRNVRGSYCSLDVLGKVLPNVITPVQFGKVCVETKHPDGSPIKYYLVPHHTNQDLFTEALKLAVEKRTDETTSAKKHYLVLHCNYNSGFATQDTALNLTPAEAKGLLEHFDYILIGHDHHHKTDLDDRVIVLGNPFPINFGDISEKYALVLDEDGDPDHIALVWDPAVQFLEVEASDLTAEAISSDHQFIRIVGEVEAEELYEVTKQVASIWKENPNLLAVKADFKVRASASTDSAGATEHEHLLDVICRDLEGNQGLLKLFREIRNRVESANHA